MKLFAVFVLLTVVRSDQDVVSNLTAIPNSDWHLSETPGSLVVGGVEANKNEFPSIVNLLITLRRNGQENYLLLLCGGNIIDWDWILTAAHCIYYAGYEVYSIDVVAGDHNRNSNDGTEQNRSGTRTIRHGGYSSTTFANDIALIQLSRAFTPSTNVQIASVSDPSYPAYEETSSIIAGWGSRSSASSTPTNELRKANVSTFSNTECSRRYSNVQNAQIISSMLCAGASGRGACSGDSGGPLYCSTPADGSFVCGLSSFVVEGQCGNVNYPTVFTRTSSFVSWVKQYVPNLKTSGYTQTTTTLRTTTLRTTTTRESGSNVNSVQKIFIGLSSLALFVKNYRM